MSKEAMKLALEAFAKEITALREALAKEQPTQRKPLTDELNQIAEALHRHNLTLIKTAHGYDVMNLGQIAAHGIKENT